MWTCLALAAAPLALLSIKCRAHQPAAYLDAFHGFIEGFLHTDGIIASGNSSVLADDCVGRVDLINTITGIQSNTEHLYGLFSSAAQFNTTQLIGVPTGTRVQSLAIQGSIVSASITMSMLYPTIAYTLPVQIDLWLSFNGGLKIQFYDVAFRRLPEALAYLIPKLAPQMSKELEQTYTASNVTDLVSLQVARDICTVSTKYCTGDNQQYDSYDSCTQFVLHNVSFGQIWQADQNNRMCRYIQKNVVMFRPDEYCANIGPSGGSTCIDRDYANDTTDFPFASGLVATNSSYSGHDTKGLSDKTVDELTEISLGVIYPTTVAFYSIPTIVYFFLLYVCAKFVAAVLGRFSKVFRSLSHEHQRNTVTYVLSTFWTLVAFIIQLIAFPMLLERYTVFNVSLLHVATILISGLYIFELTYRPIMRWPLIIHHICTLLAIVFLQIVLQVTSHPAIAVAGLIWLFQATTEQSVFIGLFIYRLQYPKSIVKPTLQFSAVQSFICKMAFATYLIVWWGIKLAPDHATFDVALSVILVILISLLMSTQIYGSYAVWCIARSMDRPRCSESIEPSITTEVNHPRDIDKQQSSCTIVPN
ncbi:uncharacterized protein EV420DRAFT_1765195 [Desarmillaria tabescens]|uniref:TRP C-terminal domain-containing protein n=1 Tax=Armillaria tabescens TaxID=1929756 RepID=A0AA39N3S3_ARMTA|nr:uncharacterized protein EV420DRAFT_1765195 [Desarmillaria tabescens]KAK0457111.1 hypothetical protein EV420DRAFT_1765195 [Desarmillaria tabescens]